MCIREVIDRPVSGVLMEAAHGPGNTSPREVRGVDTLAKLLCTAQRGPFIYRRVIKMKR